MENSEHWIVYEGNEGPGAGKHIVLVSGDEEYRSEEALPLLAKILSVHHGFKCTVLFAIDTETGGNQSRGTNQYSRTSQSRNRRHDGAFHSLS